MHPIYVTVKLAQPFDWRMFGVQVASVVAFVVLSFLIWRQSRRQTKIISLQHLAQQMATSSDEHRKLARMDYLIGLVEADLDHLDPSQMQVPSGQPLQILPDRNTYYEIVALAKELSVLSDQQAPIDRVIEFHKKQHGAAPYGQSEYPKALADLKEPTLSHLKWVIRGRMTELDFKCKDIDEKLNKHR